MKFRQPGGFEDRSARIAEAVAGHSAATSADQAITSEILVSVVITCYNQACYLAEAIQSCVNQTHRKTELIVVDDGSTDETAAVAGRFSQIRYFWQENQGVSVARNAGLDVSKGTYVVFLDADDRLLPNSIEDSLECFRMHPSCSLVVGRYRKIAADGSPISPPNRMCGARDFYCALLKANVIGMHGAVLYRRATLRKVGGFDRRFRASEDYDIALRIARNFDVQEHDNLVAEYRWHDQNMSWDYEFMLKDALTALRAQLPHAKAVPKYEEAFRIGMANWRRHYSSLILADVTKEIRARGFRLQVLRRTLSLGRTDPALMPAIARRGWFHVWSRLLKPRPTGSMR